MGINHKPLSIGLKLDQEKVDERLIMLCDGVFAIAITLLVLDIKLDVKGGDINTAISDLLKGKILFYIITFFVIANYWIIHRELMHIIKRMDALLIRLTFLFLAFITFFPVAFTMLADYGQFAQVTILYTLVLAGCGFSAQLLWWCASWNHRLIDPNMDLREIRYRTISGLIVPVFICLSLLLIPFVHDPTEIYYSWLLLLVIHRVTSVIHKRIQKGLAEEKDQKQQTLASNEPAR